jgi:multidrug efflux pump subunit AcrB
LGPEAAHDDEGHPPADRRHSDAQNNGLAANLVIDRPTASRLGITPPAIDNILYDAFGEREIATTYTPINQYFVVMEVDAELLAEPGRAERTSTCPRPAGGMVPLSAFTHFGPRRRPLAVNHSGVFPSVTISFNLAPGVALGDAVNLINGAEQAGPADHDHRFLQRHRPGVQRLARKRAPADPGSRLRGLHRPRHPL